jgi:hypothetical protein
MLEPTEQPLFAQQALDEVEVALLVLDRQRALGICGRIGEIPAPGRCEFALVRVVGEDGFDDLHHGLALEHVSIDAVAEHAQPRLDHEPVAGQPAVAALERSLGDVAVKGAEQGAAARRQQLEQRRLADQALEFDVGVGGERVHDEPKAARRSIGARPDRLVDLHALGQQHVFAERRVQHQQPVVLRRCTRERGEDLLVQTHGNPVSTRQQDAGFSSIRIGRNRAFPRKRGTTTVTSSVSRNCAALMRCARRAGGPAPRPSRSARTASRPHRRAPRPYPAPVGKPAAC